jgi:hypothetical protein
MSSPDPGFETSNQPARTGKNLNGTLATAHPATFARLFGAPNGGVIKLIHDLSDLVAPGPGSLIGNTQVVLELANGTAGGSGRHEKDGP